MASPNFQDRSFEQLARRALRRACFDADLALRDRLIQRARLADIRAASGVHAGTTRAKARRWAIHQRQRSAATLSVMVAA